MNGYEVWIQIREDECASRDEINVSDDFLPDRRGVEVPTLRYASLDLGVKG